MPTFPLLLTSPFIGSLAAYTNSNMHKNIPIAFIWLIVAFTGLSAQDIQSPSEFLGYELGKNFTYHHRVIDYFEYVDQASDKVTLKYYGYTNEGRPLVTAILTSEKNHENLDEIRLKNLEKVGFEKNEQSGTQLPIVWLSYNIHGNEAVSTEASMKVLHHLVTGDKTQWLEDMIIILDPCINPDGRDRYTNWYRQAMNQPYNILGDSWEHHEPWPGGRFNHYLFDLNRDWAWQTQVESQQRARLYHQWMPHIHVDFHEMGSESHYFFAPSAAPFHEVITDWQREFHQIIGKNHAKYFDKNGWLYFTGERYDLLYPSYGDSWPTYQGAMGFTYEQGGSGRAGVELKLNNSPGTISLDDRIAHHFSTSLSSIEAAHQNKTRLLSEFNDFFKEAVNSPMGKYKAYVLSAENNRDKMKRLLKMMDGNKINYGYAKSASKSVKGFDYQQNKEGNFNISTDDIIIPLQQPNARLVKVLFEPTTVLEDSITYDLTAWSLPYAYDLKAYASTNKVNISEKEVDFTFSENKASSENTYAYLAKWKDVSDVALLGNLIKEGIHVRRADLPFTISGQSYDRGTLIITRRDNPSPDFDQKVLSIANKHQKTPIASPGGMVDKGRDFGSGDVTYIKPPKVALINGDGVSPSAFGELWHYFEQNLKFPVTVINTDYLRQIDLTKYDVIVLGSGRYSQFREKFLDFADQGGKVVAIEGAISTFTSFDKGAGGRTNLARSMDSQSRRSEFSLNRESDLPKFGDRTRSRISNFVAGTIYKVTLDETHPLAFGQDKEAYFLKRNRTVYPYLTNGGWNVGIFKGDASISGFTGYKLKKSLENSLALGTERYGRGQIIYFSDSPIIRGFWQSGELLLGNAIFF